MNKHELEKKIGRYKATFNTEAGMKVMEDLKKVCYHERSVDFAQTIDPYKLAYVEGMRNVLNYILGYVNRKIGE